MKHRDWVKKITVMQCDMIEHDNYLKKTQKKPIVSAAKKRTRWQSGICKICGEYFTCIATARLTHMGRCGR